MGKPITLQIQIEVSEERLTNETAQEVLKQMYAFTDSFASLGYTRAQMYIGEASYNGEPL